MMRSRSAWLALAILLLSLVPVGPARTAAAATAAATAGAAVEYAVTVKAPPEPSISITASFTGLTAPVRLAIGLQGWSTFDTIADLSLSTPEGRPLTYTRVDNRTIAVAGNPTAVVAHYTQNLAKAQYRGDKVSDIGGKLSGRESLLMPATQPLASARIRFDLPAGWQLVSTYPQEGEWSVIRPYSFADLALEVGVGGWYFGKIDLDETKTYPDGFRIRAVLFQGASIRAWDLYAGDTKREEALKAADFYHQLVAKYRQLFGAFPFDDLLLVGPDFFQAGLTWHAQGLRGMREAEFMTHHALHTYVWNWPGHISPGGASWVLLREGLTSYAEGMHTAELTGDPMWRGMLYDRSFLYTRARKYGNFTQNSRQYVLGPIVAFLVEDRIRQETGGRKGLDDLMALLWRKYGGPGTEVVDDARLVATLNELTGSNWQSFYDANIRTTDHLDVSVMNRVKPDFPAYLKAVTDQYYDGHPSAYFINAELLAATGDLDMTVRMQSPLMRYSAAHLTMGDFALAARRYKNLAKGDLTEAEITAILGQMTGKDHSDLFAFYRGLGFTVDPADISEYVRTFSYNSGSDDNHVRLTARMVPVGGPTVVEAELDPAFASSETLELQVNAFAPPGGLADPSQMAGGAGVCLAWTVDWPNGEYGTMTQYGYHLPKIERDGKTYTRFTLNLPADSGVLQLFVSAKDGKGHMVQDLITPRFQRGVPLVTPNAGDAPAGVCGAGPGGGATGGQGQPAGGATGDAGQVRLTTPPDVTLGQATRVEAELGPDFAGSEALVLQLNVYSLASGTALRDLVSGEGVTYWWDQTGVQGQRGEMSQVFFNLSRHTDGGKTYTAFTLNLPPGMGAVEYLLNAGPADEVSQHQAQLQLNHVKGAAPTAGPAVPADPGGEAVSPGAAAGSLALAYHLTLAEEDHPAVAIQVTGAPAGSNTFTFGVLGGALNSVKDLPAIFSPVTVAGADGRPLAWHWQDRAIVVENGAVTAFTIRYGVDALRIGRADGMKLVLFRKLTSVFTADLVFPLPAATPGRMTVGFTLPDGIRIFSNLPEEDGQFVATTDLWGNLTDDFAKAYFTGGRPLFDVTHRTSWGDTYHYVWFDRDVATEAWVPSYGTTPWEEAQAYMAKTERLAAWFRDAIGPLPPHTLLFTNTKQAGPQPPDVKSAVDFYHYMQIWPRGDESDIAHHLVHAYSYFPAQSKLAFDSHDPVSQMLSEGLAMYFEMAVPAKILGEEYLSGKLFEALAVDWRGLPFGIAANQMEQIYNRPLLKVYLLDQYLRQATGGKSDVTTFTRALWEQVKENPHPQTVTRPQLDAAFMAVSGEANADGLRRIASRTDFAAADFAALLPQFRTYADWMAEQYFGGNRLLFLAFLDVVAAQGNEWPHYATNAHNVIRYRDQVLPLFRSALAGKSGPLTQDDVLAMLKAATGQEHAGFFAFWSEQGFDLDPNSLLPLTWWPAQGQDESNFMPLNWQSLGVLQTEHYLSGIPQEAAAVLDEPAPAAEVTVQVQLASYDGYPPLAEAQQAVRGDGVVPGEAIQLEDRGLFVTRAYFRVKTTDSARQRFPFVLTLPPFASHATFGIVQPDGDPLGLYALHAIDPIPFRVALDGRNVVTPPSPLAGGTYRVGEPDASGRVQVDLLDADGFLRGRQLVVLPETPVRVMLNGQPVAFDVAPVRVAGRLLVPLRTIAEALGAQVGWNEATHTVMLSRGGSAITLVIGSQTAQVDGAPVTLEAAPEIRDGRTLVPLRFVAESLGLTVEWDAPTQTAHLTSQ